MRKRLWDLAKSRIEIGTILPGHRHKVWRQAPLMVMPPEEAESTVRVPSYCVNAP